MKKILLLLLLALGLIGTKAQDQVIKGKVIDEEGIPLAGATITIKGTATSVTTDAQGNFQINSGGNVNPVLVVSYIGYADAQVQTARNSGNVSLKKYARAMNDIIVVVYRTHRKRDV